MNKTLNSNPLVYILVLNYQSLADTLHCISAIEKLNYDNYRFIVIDNNSNDGSSEHLSKSLPQDNFIQLKKNIGYAGGNNRGIRIALDAGADYILIVNPDIRLKQDALQTYVEIMQGDSAIGALNSIQLQENQTTIDKNFLLGVLKPNGIHDSEIFNHNSPFTVDSHMLFGAALMLSSAAIKTVGGFDPLFFAYGEETDLCRRLRLHNYRLIVTSKSPVTHLRTIYNKPLSKRVLFLRLKGYYLSRLKNPELSIKPTLHTIFREINTALFGRANTLYPYNTYPYNRKIILKTLTWLIFFLPAIYLHKRQEKSKGAFYI